MKFQLAQSEGFAITGYTPGCVRINADQWRESFLLFPDRGAQKWRGIPAAQIEADAAWQDIVAYAPAILVIGTGEKLRFPHPSLLRPLIEARIGYEVMDTAAACRTYSVLLSEARKVCAAIVIDRV